MRGPPADKARYGRLVTVSLIAALGFVLTGAAVAAYDENQVARQRLDAATVEAGLLAESEAGPLAAGDAAAARDRLVAVTAYPELEAAGVYGPDGALLTGWSRSGARPAPAKTSERSVTGPGSFVLNRPVLQGGRRLGAVYLRTVREPAMQRLIRYGGIGLLILMAALLVGALATTNAALVSAHRRLRKAMIERGRAETALRRSQQLASQAEMESMRERGMAAFRRYAADMEFALAAGQLGGWSRDLRTNRFTASAIFRAHYGFERRGRWLGAADFLSRVHPEDRAEHVRRVETAVAEGGVLESEFRTVLPDGRVRWLLVLGRAEYGDDHRPIRLAGVSMDITVRKTSEERQRMLLDELNHRVKNTLASVQSIALQTGRTAETAEEFESAFLARINALARVHDLLTTVSWEGASLADIVAQTLAPYEGRALDGRAGYSGPDVRLGPNAAVTLAMAFHELATNAAKYGALSNDRGRIDIDWRIEHGAEGELVEINWSEHGGPPIGPPKRRGFGTQFLQRALAREFDGRVNLRFTAPGLNCRMRLPLSAKLRLAA
ncbi:MAG TPA: HWE histidine kinase domain-containing protein [Caulobacteraceae bacterium]|nr:HWE histidine kinase domain-containing protein [Caulobacteraceae bacterium]